jgi:hypothetical protein
MSALYEGLSRSFRTSSLGQELQMIQLSANRCSYITILWDSLVRFAAITLCVASQRVFIVVVVCLVIDSVRKLLDIPSYVNPSEQLRLAEFQRLFNMQRIRCSLFLHSQGGHKTRQEIGHYFRLRVIGSQVKLYSLAHVFRITTPASWNSNYDCGNIYFTSWNEMNTNRGILKCYPIHIYTEFLRI